MGFAVPISVRDIIKGPVPARIEAKSVFDVHTSRLGIGIFSRPLLDAECRNDVASPAQAQLASTLASARGSAVERQLLNPAILQLAGLPAGAAVSGSIADAISPLAFNNPLVTRRLNQLRDNALAARGACLVDAAPEPSSLTGLADILARKFPPAPDETPSQQQQRSVRC